jgi:pimeloyl-ACP methyl ester carboxylesterase
MQTKSEIAHVNGIELAYQVVGTGKPVVLLHGGFGSAEMYGFDLQAFGDGHKAVAVDLQSHGRSPAANRPMRWEAMADDIAALITQLDIAPAALVGYSLGGGVALRTAIQHPEVVERLVLVSTPFTSHGWHPEMQTGMRSMGPESAEPLKQSPMFAVYREIAPNVDNWPKLVEQLTTLLKIDYDWAADIPKLSMPVMLVIGDADGMPPSHAVEFFGLLGGGKRDANWDRSGMTRHRLAILPGATHYDISMLPALSETVIPFLS